jgi:DNA-binding NarL/FixJ family response regulator
MAGDAGGCNAAAMPSAIAGAIRRILLVDDHPAVSQGVERLLEDEADFEVAAVATTGRAARRLAAALRPDVAVVDMQLPGVNGVLLTHDLLAERVVRAAVVYTAFADDRVRLGALVAGASAAVSKGELGSELVDAVRAAARGSVALPRVSAAAQLEAGIRLDGDDLPILGMIRNGTAPAEIADVLGISPDELARRRRAMVEVLLGAPVAGGPGNATASLPYSRPRAPRPGGRATAV